MIDLLRYADEVRARVAVLKSQGKTLALVPTMGFLHQGHLSLMREGAKLAHTCAVSIFVNPAQFGPTEDLKSYPRDEKGDLEKCASAGAHLVWAPEVAEVYPSGYQTYVEVANLSQRWCGETRPVHFRGVATVVAKLFAIFRPDFALFGEKDFQQLQLIRQLNRDLGFGVQIVGMPIVREADGLAMSSRNSYLTAPERQRALALHHGLQAASKLHQQGERNAACLKDAALAHLQAVGARVEYVALVDSQTLEPVDTVDKPSRMLIAAFIGKTRLIDNIAI